MDSHYLATERLGDSDSSLADATTARVDENSLSSLQTASYTQGVVRSSVDHWYSSCISRTPRLRNIPDEAAICFDSGGQSFCRRQSHHSLTSQPAVA